jgi:hypothetical protein
MLKPMFGLVVAGLVLGAQPALFAQVFESPVPGRSGSEIEPSEVVRPSYCRVLDAKYANAPKSVKYAAALDPEKSAPAVTSTRNQGDYIYNQTSRPSEGLLVDPPTGVSAAASLSEPSGRLFCFPEAFTSN